MDAIFDDVLDVDPASMSRGELLDLLERIEHVHAALYAKAQVALACLARDGDALARNKEWVREEVACALSIAPVTAANRLHDAVEMVERLPGTLDRLTSAEISMGHARVMVEAARSLDDDTVARLEHRVLPKAEGTPIGVFRQSVKRAALALDPRGGEQRHREAYGERSVVMRADQDGMANIYAYLRADHAGALMTSLDAHAGKLPDDGRTIDQKRADVLADLGSEALHAAGTTWQGHRPAVQVSVALSTLLGVDEQPGELDGYGPIPASLAREIAHDPSSTWRRLVTDFDGRLIRCGQRTYRPPAALRDHLVATHKTCTFPGCRRNACRAEIDHIVPFPGGGTDPENLHTPCKRHHLAKHEAGWRVRKDDHAVIWTSPRGRQYASATHTYPIDRTVSDPDPPPF